MPTWFSSWDRLVDIAFGGVYFYALLVVLVRMQGKRTTSQLNNFDWIITIAVGSIAASGILLEETPLLEATVAIVVISLCQWILTWSVSRSDRVARIVRASPRLLIRDGEYLEDAMKAERIAKEELRGKLREAGIARREQVEWVVLETHGAISVIPKSDPELDVDDSALVNAIAGSRPPPDHRG